MATERDRELYQAAVLHRLDARTPEEEAYFRGYVAGISNRLAIGIEQDGSEAAAYARMQDAADRITRALGAGYRDGLAGETLRRRKTP